MSEQKTVYKIFPVWDFEKEEDWLNEMAMQGWALCGMGFCRYTFEKCEPGEYIIRLAYEEKRDEYRDFVTSSGAEYIGNCIRWMYFRQRAEYGNFELNPDCESKIHMLKQVAKMLKIVGLANLAVGCANKDMGIINLLCAMLLFYALGRIEGKLDEIERMSRFQE